MPNLIKTPEVNNYNIIDYNTLTCCTRNILCIEFNCLPTDAWIHPTCKPHCTTFTVVQTETILKHVKEVHLTYFNRIIEMLR